MLRFPCPHCQARLSAPEDTQGRTSRCHKCGRPVSVPRIGKPVSAGMGRDKTVLGEYLAYEPTPAVPPAPTYTTVARTAPPVSLPSDTRPTRKYGLGCLAFCISLMIVVLGGYILFLNLPKPRADDSEQAKARKRSETDQPRRPRPTDEDHKVGEARRPDPPGPKQERPKEGQESKERRGQEPPKDEPRKARDREQSPPPKEGRGRPDGTVKNPFKFTDFRAFRDRWAKPIREAAQTGNPLVMEDITRQYQEELKGWGGKYLEGPATLLDMYVPPIVEERSIGMVPSIGMFRPKKVKPVQLTIAVEFGPDGSERWHCDVLDPDDPVLRKLVRGKPLHVRGVLRLLHQGGVLRLLHQEWSLKECQVFLEEPDRRDK